MYESRSLMPDLGYIYEHLRFDATCVYLLHKEVLSDLCCFFNIGTKMHLFTQLLASLLP